MQACYSCSKKPIKNGVYRAHSEEILMPYFPDDNTHFHKIGAPSKMINDLKPNTCVFYFATKKRLITNDIIKFKDAYGSLTNSGVTRTNSKGQAKFFLDCPQVYIALNGNIYNRHFHYIYWDDKKKIWNTNLYTQPIICEISSKFLMKYMNKVLIIDALPINMYNKKHIKGAYNLPVNKRWTENDLKKIVKEKFNTSSKNIPIVVYCFNLSCEASTKVLKKIEKLGYKNIVDYPNGISGWKGPTE
tara:strand:+ start:508 stop:1242 length:735 start_codon:yes stop_codon:yes gene_type:complete